MKENVEAFAAKYRGQLVALGWQKYEQVGRCAVTLKMPSVFGVGAETAFKDVEILTWKPKLTVKWRLLYLAILLRYWPVPLLRFFSKGNPNLSLVAATLRYDPKKQIVLFVTYPDGVWFLRPFSCELTPPEAWAQASAQIKRRVRGS